MRGRTVGRSQTRPHRSQTECANYHRLALRYFAVERQIKRIEGSVHPSAKWNPPARAAAALYKLMSSA